MRAGVCSVQQALTAEAASMVKQALGLARRRGHAQVTPLHVASAMLVSSTGLLQRACLQSHSHPLQFRALELCFNVALNRLPASTCGPLLAPHHHPPSLSNALVAAFKRAQAHQRRGSIENQQQPILALKIELEHLIISILDDPSVSRVMREAGFSSTQVKTKVEQTVSLEITSQTPSPKENNAQTRFGFGFSSSNPLAQVRNDQDVTNVLSTIVNRRGNTVIIGESVAIAESVVRGVMDKFEKGQVSGDLRYLQLISLPLFSLKNLAKEEVEQKLVELKCLVKSYIGRGVVLYLGDLKWISEFWSSYGDQRRNYYCPVEHIIMELKRLVSGTKESGKLFLMGIATFRTYIKCKSGHPSLESIWELCPLTISADSLSLSLNLESCDSQSQYRAKESIDSISWPVAEAEVNKIKNGGSFTDRLFNFDNVVSSSSSLPSWLQSYKEETKTNSSHDNKDYKKCNAEDWPVIFESNKSPKERQFWISENDPKPDLLSNPNSSPNSASSSEAIEEDIDRLNSFKALNAENMNILCNALEKHVPWQKDVIPEIVSTVLECRSGMRKSKGWLNQREVKEETWLFFLGSDNEAKQKIARELARLVFGSQTSFASISLSDFGSKRADSNEDNKRKRSNDPDSSDVLQRFGEALNENPHKVFFMEDMEHVDYGCLKRMKQAIETGKVTVSDGVTVPVMDAIVIFSSESFSSMWRACSSRRKPNCSDPEEMKEAETEQDKDQSVSLDLNIAIGDNSEEDGSGNDDEIGVLKCVDNQIVFRVKEQ
ncbi:SMAX1-like 3 [Hibiscus trionum]|uniref:SMAX1-like 3 n=1 Tax=Hibiscus trionum TaxID=183268 RepID=A0A9W7M1U2_HIBTR|nr:SMAX1-like 3 [Hibiscus trionum]